MGDTVKDVRELEFPSKQKIPLLQSGVLLCITNHHRVSLIPDYSSFWPLKLTMASLAEHVCFCKEKVLPWVKTSRQKGCHSSFFYVKMLSDSRTKVNLTPNINSSGARWPFHVEMLKPEVYFTDLNNSFSQYFTERSTFGRPIYPKKKIQWRYRLVKA